MTRSDIAKLSDEEANVLIAELCPDLFEVHGTWRHGNYVYFLVKTGEGIPGDEINPCSDLNAMHEAENSLTPEQSEQYSKELVAKEDAQIYALYHATPRQKAEAFLATMGQGSGIDAALTTVDDGTKKKVNP